MEVNVKANLFAAIIGYGYDCPEENLEMAEKLGRVCAERGYSLCAGGFIGTFEAAFRGAKAGGGNTLLCLDGASNKIDTRFIDTVELFQTTDEKHKRLSELVELTFVIGGGSGSLKLLERIHGVDKKIIRFGETGGAARDFDKGVNYQWNKFEEDGYPIMRK